MSLLSVSYKDFRNIADGTIDFNAREVFFIGENAQGKSNLLESIYCLAYGSSFRSRGDSEIVKKGKSDFSLNALCRGDENGFTGTLSVSFDGSKKKIVKNGKTLKDRRDLITTIPCVVFCHDDLQFVSGEPERRRFFLDQCLSMHDLLHLDSTRNYSRILKSRNICIHDGRTELLSVFDVQLAKYGVEVQSKRADAVFSINQFFGMMYESVSGIDGVSILYSPSWKGENGKINEEEAQRILLEKRFSDDAMLTTTSGPHRDRIRFVRAGTDFVPLASTGQRRLLAVLLRVAQAVFYTRSTSRKPILLLDDVLLELDPEKRRKVTEILPEYEQLFCTFLPGEPWERYAKDHTKTYMIRDGIWS